ncbi:ciliary basal body-associated, B9 protein-domain-containing protein [Haematococcus lacustris]
MLNPSFSPDRKSTLSSSVATEASLSQYVQQRRPATHQPAITHTPLHPGSHVSLSLQPGAQATEDTSQHLSGASPEPGSGGLSPAPSGTLRDSSLLPLRSSQEPLQAAGVRRAGSGTRMSRLMTRSRVAHSRDSSSEQDSKPPPRDVTRDERGRRVERSRVVRADVHFIGEISGASDFRSSQPALFCRYRLLYDGFKSWSVAQGEESGTTQVASAGPADLERFIPWEHPLDLHLTTQKLEAWPRLLLMVFARDDATRRDCFVSYAVCPLPVTPGIHHMSCRTWQPVEAQRIQQRTLTAAFLGIAPRMDDDLSDMGFIANASLREEAGPHIWSMGQGTVHLRLQMLCKHLGALTRQQGDSLYKSLENFQANIEASRRKEQMRNAAMQEYQQEGKETTGSTNGAGDGESAGLRQLREGRQARFESARQALEARRSSHSSLAGGELDRSRSVDPMTRRAADGSDRETRAVHSAPRDSRSGTSLRRGASSSGHDDFNAANESPRALSPGRQRERSEMKPRQTDEQRLAARTARRNAI